MWFAIAMGCAGDDGAGTGTDGATDGPTTAPFAGRAVGEPSGDCPKFKTGGDQSMTVDGVDREIVAYWPKQPDGPVGLMFAWHGLGDSADNFSDALDLETLARQNNMLVVAPYSLNPLLVTWDYLSGGGNDLLLVDDVRACADQAFDLDLNRVVSTGFSFGALWTTFLTMERSDVFSGTLTFSGGTGPAVGMSYSTPATAIPVLVAWGGEDDGYDAGMIQVNFEETSLDFAEGLEGDGHTVVRCDHGLGHSLPFDWDVAVTEFLFVQSFGTPSPVGPTALDTLPDWCQ